MQEGWCSRALTTSHFDFGRLRQQLWKQEHQDVAVPVREKSRARAHMLCAYGLMVCAARGGEDQWTCCYGCLCLLVGDRHHLLSSTTLGGIVEEACCEVWSAIR